GAFLCFMMFSGGSPAKSRVSLFVFRLAASARLRAGICFMFFSSQLAEGLANEESSPPPGVAAALRPAPSPAVRISANKFVLLTF
ncbi:hypothetical protein, partial [uncultured Alistipes sp.]|uniref:hypothetical protein n=1 Tax=uncultured Alistipes sp. TaxID=538949 RepID=UPI00260F0D2A